MKKKIEVLIEKIKKMKDDSGRPNCTYGDTKYDSLSAVFGYNLAIEHIIEELEKELKNDKK